MIIQKGIKYSLPYLTVVRIEAVDVFRFVLRPTIVVALVFRRLLIARFAALHDVHRLARYASRHVEVALAFVHVAVATANRFDVVARTIVQVSALRFRNYIQTHLET